MSYIIPLDTYSQYYVQNGLETNYSSNYVNI